MERFFFLLEIAAIIAFKEFIKAWAKEILKRRKKRTAPTVNRDGSGDR